MYRTRLSHRIGSYLLPISLGLVLLAPGPADADEIDEAVFRAADRLAGRFDEDRDGRIDAAERESIEREVEKTHGRRGLGLLHAVLTRADTDGDDVVVVAEWHALGKCLDFDATWVAPETHRLRMSDGVHLATDVWVRPGAPAGPAILLRTPYGRRRSLPPLLDLGYAVVVQDVRGRFASEGENLPFVGCGWGAHQDGVETVAWIRAQPFCDGRVATFGGSALGITQNLLAGAAPEGLVCQHVTVAAASLYHHAAYVGGALRKSQVEQWLLGNDFDEKALRLYRAHPRYDAFWHDFDSTRQFGAMTVPALHVGGWFDTFSQGTVSAFVGRKEHGGEGSRGAQLLVMGPWAHGGHGRGGRVGELAFPSGRIPPPYAARAFFRRHLEGKGAPPAHAVTYYVMGDVETEGALGNVWRFADTWPPLHTETAFHLGADGTLGRAAPAVDAASISFTFDPADPCPTLGGANLVLPAGPMDQRSVEHRADVVVFTSEPLQDALEIAGAVKAVLHVSSDAVDTDLSVRFCDVYPDGRSFLMAEGMLRLRLREGFEAPKPLVPGQIERVVVECWPTSVAFAPGHRIRVSVTSSNFPRFDVNPGTGRPARPDGKRVVQTNRIHCSTKHPSRILLPVTAGTEGR